MSECSVHKRDNDAKADLGHLLETNVTAEDEGGDEHEDDKEHSSDGADCSHFWHMMYANLEMTACMHIT